MGKAGRKTVTNPVDESPVNTNPPAWNFNKKDLGALIFVCSDHTIQECHSKLLFGLPHVHISYVKNIDPGLPLFLFNYSDRTMHGIYEAASHGKMNMDQFAWTGNVSGSTLYPAQVRFRLRKRCQPLSEKQFRKVIYKNYTDHNDRKAFFRLELDKKQTRELISLFERFPVTKSSKEAPKHKPPPTTVPNLEKITTKEASSESINMELGVPSEFLSSTGTWAALFKKKSDPISTSEVEGLKPLESEAEWGEDPVSLDSQPSSWDGEKQYLDAHSNEAAIEDDQECVYLKLKDLAYVQEDSSLEYKATIEDGNEIGFSDLESTFERVYSNLEDYREDVVACRTDTTILIDQLNGSSMGYTSERAYSNLEDHREDVVACGTDTTILIDQLRKELEEWKAFSMEQHRKTTTLENKLSILETYSMEQYRRTNALEKKLSAIEKEHAALAKRKLEPAISEWELAGPEEMEEW